jgi:hypothetical protein
MAHGEFLCQPPKAVDPTRVRLAGLQARRSGQVRIPMDADQRSELMSITVPK